MNNLLKYCDVFYKLATEQLEFPFMENIEEKAEDNTRYNFEDWLGGYETITYQELLIFFEKLGIDHKPCGGYDRKPLGFTFEYNAKKYIVLADSWPISMNANISPPEEVKEFLNQSFDIDDLNKYLNLDDDEFNKDFWNGPTTLYHATSQNNIDQIMDSGLEPRSYSRGISNRSTGSAVYCSLNPDEVDVYGDIILEIDAVKMKQDGIMPYVKMEPDIEYSEKINSLAHMLGVEDYHYDVESGMSPETVVMFGHIPPKYIKVLEE